MLSLNSSNLSTNTVYTNMFDLPRVTFVFHSLCLYDEVLRAVNFDNAGKSY